MGRKRIDYKNPNDSSPDGLPAGEKKFNEVNVSGWEGEEERAERQKKQLERYKKHVEEKSKLKEERRTKAVNYDKLIEHTVMKAFNIFQN